MLARARADKKRNYAELLVDDCCQLVVVGDETGGRWSREAAMFIGGLFWSTRGASSTPFFGIPGVGTPLVPHALSLLRARVRKLFGLIARQHHGRH